MFSWANLIHSCRYNQTTFQFGLEDELTTSNRFDGRSVYAGTNQNSKGPFDTLYEQQYADESIGRSHSLLTLRYVVDGMYNADSKDNLQNK